MEKQIISLQLPKDLIDKLKQIADREGTTISAVIRRILLNQVK